MAFLERECSAGDGGVVPTWNRPPRSENLLRERLIEMKKIVLAVALLLLAGTAMNAAPPARQGRPTKVKPVPPPKQPATKGQGAKQGLLPNQAAAPLRLDASGGGTINPGVNPAGAVPGQTGTGGFRRRPAPTPGPTPT
jgi:hypothetical protein